MRDLEPTDLEFFETAKHRITGSARLSASPAKVFASLAENSDWLKWFPMVKSIEWITGTGGLGSEREVVLGGGLGHYRERYIAWEPATRYAFTMFGTTSPMFARLAEDFRLTPDGTGTKLDWVMAAQPTKLGWVTWPITKAVMGSFFRRGTKKLEPLLAAMPVT